MIVVGYVAVNIWPVVMMKIAAELLNGCIGDERMPHRPHSSVKVVCSHLRWVVCVRAAATKTTTGRQDYTTFHKLRGRQHTPYFVNDRVDPIESPPMQPAFKIKHVLTY